MASGRAQAPRTTPHIDVHRSGDRLKSRVSWLDSKHSFSFGQHYDPDNTHHGLLLVNNDDTVLAGTGFDTHPHKDMEIVTWVLRGSLVHQDSIGHTGVIYPGLAQRMSAGTGIMHSEKNDSWRIGGEQHSDPVHFIQMWVVPDEGGLTPGYEQLEIDDELLRGGLIPVASGNGALQGSFGDSHQQQERRHACRTHSARHLRESSGRTVPARLRRAGHCRDGGRRHTVRGRCCPVERFGWPAADLRRRGRSPRLGDAFTYRWLRPGLGRTRRAGDTRRMSIDNSAAPVKKLDPLNTLMGVRAVSVEPGDLAFAQAVGERFHDHRGKTVLGSIGVMIDGAMGGAVYSGLTSGHQSVLAQVTVSAGADIPDVADVGATGTLVHLDDGVGLASGQLRDENGTLLAVMAGRAMVVSRPPVVGIDDYVEGEPLPVPTPEKTSDLSGLSGSDVVEGIRDGKLERGPLAGLLDLAVVDVTPGSVVGEFAPVAWMANPLGAVQGGVLISAVDAITGLSAQTLTSVDQDYRVLDHKIDFLRSPDIGGPVLRAEASVIRAGRRLALIETRIVDAGGQVYVRATSSIQMLSQQVHSG